MRTIVVLDNPSYLTFLKNYLNAEKNQCFIVPDRKAFLKIYSRKGVKVYERKDLGAKGLYTGLDLSSEDKVIFCFLQDEELKRCLDLLLTLNDSIPVLCLVHNGSGFEADETCENVVFLSVGEHLFNMIPETWRIIENRKKISILNKVTKEAENILILLQDDPDPDALASALALRIILGRNKQTAPIGSFGNVTRTENLNMMKLLDIPIRFLDTDALTIFDKIALVDVQPPYFSELNRNADIVIDHHPYQEKYDCDFTDIRVSYGSTSTILGEYLIDGNFKITQRLATALSYGIKTDTMFLDRGTSPADIEVFIHLYKYANVNVLRQIENVTLDYSEIDTFIKAFKSMRTEKNLLFAYLDRVERDDIIPRIADFCLQIGGSDWAIVSGIFKEDIICSIRNVGYVKHAGETANRAFGSVGSAGGHRSLARAVIPIKKFKDFFNISSVKAFEDKIIEVFLDTVK